jgi:hypothetical protein
MNDKRKYLHNQKFSSIKLLNLVVKFHYIFQYEKKDIIIEIYITIPFVIKEIMAWRDC